MKIKNQEGAIIIEAMIALTAFMFAIVMILALVNICLVQSKVSTLVHGVAKDLSNYSYLYSMTGAREAEANLSNDSNFARHGIEEVIDNSTNVFEAIGNIGNSEAFLDPEFWGSFVSLVKEAALNGAKGEVVAVVCRNVAEKRLTNANQSADAYLRHLGIEDGVDGLKFNTSEFCVGGTDDIKVICRYKVHVLKLLGIDYEFNFVQCAHTKAWAAPKGGGTHENTPDPESGSENSSEAEHNTHQDTTETTESTESTEATTEAAEATTEADNRTIAEMVEDATHNPDSPQVMLGRWVDYYDGQAENYDMTYFSMDPDDYRRLEEQGQGWEANFRFLENQYAQGKDFYLCSDPYNPGNGAYYDEVEWLKNKGYTFEYVPATNVWRAVRGNVPGEE